MSVHRKITIYDYNQKLKQLYENKSPKKNNLLSPQLQNKLKSPRSKLNPKDNYFKVNTERSQSNHQENQVFSKFSQYKRQVTSQDESNIVENKSNNQALEQKIRKQEGIEKLKQQLNEQFLKQTQNNKAGTCLQYLEPTLVHNILNLSPKAQVNSDLRASISAKDANGNTALHLASLNGNTNIVQALLYKNANIEEQNDDQMTPLIISAYYGKYETFKILINLGANVNHQDKYGNTALHYACKFSFRYIIELLMQSPLLKILKNIDQYYPEQYIIDQETSKIFQNFQEKIKIKQKFTSQLKISDTQTETILKMFQRKNIPFKQQLQQCKSQTNLDLIQSNLPKINDLKTRLNQLEQFKATKQQQQLKRQTTISTQYSESQKILKEEEEILPQQFDVIGLIGKGSFGSVFLVEKEDKLYAMKVLDKTMILKRNLFRYAQTERNILSVTSHPFIVKLRYAFQTESKLIMILDFCPGGDLGQLLEDRKRLPEELVKLYLCEIILALEDLHSRDIIYRDLKPENIVIDQEGHVLLTDFGLSKEGILDAAQGAKSFCGSVAYLAPEMLKRQGHGKAVDWYLLGVVMFEMLVGVPPYYANDKSELFYNIEHGILSIPKYISNEGRSLIKSLLLRNPLKRLGSGQNGSMEIKLHPFFQGIDWTKVQNRELDLPKPTKPIRVNTQFQENIFDNIESTELQMNHQKGWTFVHSEF